jgi:hypothetical protein
MTVKANFILKIQNAKIADIQKALTDAKIDILSIVEVYSEEA